MVNIDILIKEKKVSRINELELKRYLDFFDRSYSDNLRHSEANVSSFPRWSIISGYYAMHDITKLFIAKNFRLKMDREVHATTIKVMKSISRDKKLLSLLDIGYRNFLQFASDLEEAKAERVKSQYYTGTGFLDSEYKEKSTEFLNNVVRPFVDRMRGMI